ncbi:mitochondrial PGP phosphatase-domain-containing protein [Aspergillus cavernicola]|uniref:Mitochondrial PGP phosphatase-domain-containing protein n=1 Tax=Aspergillus cavernicola TaxID=176166 RepID=A0ABR4J500_9EURO
MNPPNTNLRAFNLAVQTLLSTPSQFLPHLTIPTFTHLPENIGAALQAQYPERKGGIAIRALILDKDNTLCPAKTTTFPSKIYSKLHSLRTSPTSPFNIDSAPNSILIVSNRAGSHPQYESEAVEIEERLAGLRIPVFRLPESSKEGGSVEKKPFCGKEVLDWFRERGVVQRADEIAVVGDRLGTDVLMAAEMGSWSVWCRNGVGEEVTQGKRNVLEKMEVWVERYLRESKGFKAPLPRAYNVPRSD